jgi:hypothetical protein
MTKKIFFKKSLIILTLLLIIISFTPFITSCTPEVTFGDLNICSEIDSETYAPIVNKDEFDIDTEMIFVTIMISGVNPQDNYRFTWRNKDTEEIIGEKSDKYSSEEGGSLEGYVSSWLAPEKEGYVIAQPGDYIVDFFHNGNLESSAEFKILAPIEVAEEEISLYSYNLGNIYENQEYGFSINYPDYWEIDEYYGEFGTKVDFYAPIDFYEHYGFDEEVEYVRIQLSIEPTPATIKDGNDEAVYNYLAEKRDDSAADTVESGDFNLINREEYQGNLIEETAYEFIYYFNNSDGFEFRVDTTSLEKDGKMFSMATLAIPEFYEIIDMIYFDIINTLTFK